MNRCNCYQFETKRRYLSNIDKITYTLATERLAPEYIDEEVGVCYGTKEKDVCNCGGDRRKCGFYETVREKAVEEKNLSTSKNVLEEIEDLIGEYWGTEPIYYIDSKNEEEADAAKLCCKILEAIQAFRGENNERRTIKMKKAMLSQPMAGKTNEEIVATREKAISVLKEKGYEIVNTLFTDEWYSKEKMAERGVVQIPLCFLAKSLENMSLCHAAYFCKGWENARGCRIEHEAAVAYGLEILYEE